MFFLSKLCLFLIFGVYCEAQKPLRKEAYMTAPSLIRAAGYPVEKHRVTTSDGYILQMHRIPAGRRSASQSGELNAKRKKAIVILHGLGGCSSNFVLYGPERSLAFLLADAGYDVWLPNLRGTLSSTHTNLTKSDKKFWDFSFHEHGKYDVPAVIDRVLNVTGLDKIMCVGHSLGNTNFFTMMSLRPEYNDKLIAFVALAPAVYMGHVKDLMQLVCITLDIPNRFRAVGWWAIYPDLVQFIQEYLCDDKEQNDLCKVLVDFLFGDDTKQHDHEMEAIYLYRIQPFPWGCLEHYAKISLTGVFTTFRGGISGPVIPYNLSNIKIPVTLLYGDNDRLSDKPEVLRLEEELKTYTVLEEVEPALWHNFNHIDFVFAKDVGRLLNKPLVKHIDKLYNKYSLV